MGKVLKITLKRSRYGRKPKQRRTLFALGLRKIGASVYHKDTPQIRGMIKRVSHLVEVLELDSSEGLNGSK